MKPSIRAALSISMALVTAGSGTPTRDHQFAQFLLGLATGAQVSAQPFATRMNNFWQAYYFQDDWKVSPTLTINFGLRYEYYQPPKQRGKATNFDLNGFVPVRQTFHGFPDIADTTDRPAALVYGDRNDFGPRIGFAWQAPQIKDFVVRGGYGIYYTPEITNSWTTLTLNPPIVQTFSFTGNAANPVDRGTRLPEPGHDQRRTIRLRSARSQSAHQLHAAMEFHHPEEAARQLLLRSRLRRLEGYPAHREFRRQPPD